MHTAKNISGPYNEMPPHGGRELICHAISLHPLSLRNICRQKIWKDINMKTDI